MSQHRFQHASGAVSTYERDEATGEIYPHGPLSEADFAEIRRRHAIPEPQWLFGEEEFKALLLRFGQGLDAAQRLADAAERIAAVMEAAAQPKPPDSVE